MLTADQTNEIVVTCIRIGPCPGGQEEVCGGTAGRIACTPYEASSYMFKITSQSSVNHNGEPSYMAQLRMEPRFENCEDGKDNK